MVMMSVETEDKFAHRHHDDLLLLFWTKNRGRETSATNFQTTFPVIRPRLFERFLVVEEWTDGAVLMTIFLPVNLRRRMEESAMSSNRSTEDGRDRCNRR